MVRMKYRDKEPQIDASSFVAPSADIIGDVKVGGNCGLWFGVVVRGDMEPVTIGENSNVQDNATIHTAVGFPAHIGSYVTIGHNAVVHGCTVEDNALIGMGAVVLDGAVIGKGSIIGAGCLVGEGKVIPPRSLVVGVPGKVIRTIDEEREEGLVQHAREYVKIMKEYL